MSTATYARLARVPELRALLGAQVVSVLGDQLARVALTVLVYDRTGSALLSGLAAAATYLPWVVGGPVLAALADRFPRREVLVACDALRVVVLLLMAVPGVPVWLLVLLLAVAELAAPVTSAATAALLPDVLPDEDEYVLASGLSSTVHEVGQVVGYLLGGVAVALVGARGAFVLDAATFALSGALLLLLRRRPAPAPSGESVLRDAVDGLRAVSGSPRLRLLLPLAWLGCAASVVPEALAAPYADELGTGPVSVGWLLAAVPVGVVVGNVVVARWLPGERRDDAVLPLALVAVGSLALVGLAPGLVPSLGLLLLVGAGTAYYVLVGAMIAREVPAELRGRVFGLANTGLMLSQAAALLGAGALADLLGASAAMGACGLLGLLGTLLLGVKWRAQRRGGMPVVPAQAEPRPAPVAASA